MNVICMIRHFKFDIAAYHDHPQKEDLERELIARVEASLRSKDASTIAKEYPNWQDVLRLDVMYIVRNKFYNESKKKSPGADEYD